MKAKKRCQHCGASMEEHRHTLSKGLLSALRKIRQHTTEPVNLKELGLTRNQWDNFQKLKYWGFVVQIGNTKSGVWQITARGITFCNGLSEAPSAVWTYRGNVVRISTTNISCAIVESDESEPYQRNFSGVA